MLTSPPPRIDLLWMLAIYKKWRSSAKKGPEPRGIQQPTELWRPCAPGYTLWRRFGLERFPKNVTSMIF